MGQDRWSWLRNGDDLRVRHWLEEENSRTAEFLKQSGDLSGSLYEELKGRIEESAVSAPYPLGDWIYQSRIQPGQAYADYFRRPREAPGKWECYFNTNREAEGEEYYDLGLLEISPDGRWLAYAVDTTGEESYTLLFRDLASGRDLPHPVENVSPEGEWDASGELFYFLTEDATRRPERICRHRPGKPRETAECLHHETDPRFHAGIYKSQDGAFLFAVSQSNETTEIHHLRADDPDGPFTCLFPRRSGIRYWLEHDHGSWLVHTNEKAPDFRLLRLPVDKPALEEASTVIPCREGIRLEEVIPLERHLVLGERVDGLPRISVHNLEGDFLRAIPVPDPIHDLQPGINLVYATDQLLCEYSSPVRPSMTFRFHLDSGETEILRQTTVPSGHNPDDYQVYRIRVPSDDGVAVPMTLLHRRDLPLDGSRGAFLHGYGAYGETVEAGFRTSWLTWLERGFVVAVAHVRGGGLLGEAWYQDGKGDRKENSFRDFLACTRALEERGLSRRGRICIQGASAGGMLVGVALNRTPEWYAAAVATVPFVDCLETMLDPELPLTTFEYAEWGNPADPEVRNRFLQWSPCENVRPGNYPPVLAIAALQDARVPFHGAAKWICLLRENQRGPAPILLHTFLEEGHAGASGRYAALRETALEQAFLLQMYHMSSEGADMKSSTV